MGPNNIHIRHCSLSTATMVKRKRHNINVIVSLPILFSSRRPAIAGLFNHHNISKLYTHFGLLFNAVRSSHPSVRLWPSTNAIAFCPVFMQFIMTVLQITQAIVAYKSVLWLNICSRTRNNFLPVSSRFLGPILVKFSIEGLHITQLISCVFHENQHVESHTLGLSPKERLYLFFTPIVGIEWNSVKEICKKCCGSYVNCIELKQERPSFTYWWK